MTEKKKKDETETKGKNQYIEVSPKLNEAKSETAVFTFGRMNPPTAGHEKLVNKIKSVASSKKADAHVFLSHSYDAKKNPLPYSVKIAYAQKAFGNIVRKSDSKIIIKVVQELESLGYKNIILVVGSDRVSEFDKLLQKYNGRDYNFDSISVVSAGERDPDAEGVEGMSASKMREAAKNEDLEAFKLGLPKALQSDASKIYDEVRSGMKIAEEFDICMIYEEEDSQITIGDYKTEHFDMCPSATSLYRKIINEDYDQELVELSIKLQDMLFGIEKEVVESEKSSAEDIMLAMEIVDDVLDIAEDFDLDDEHEYLQSHIDEIMKYYDGSITEVLSLAQRRMRSLIMRKYKTKIALARKRARARAATPKALMTRARRRAIQVLRNRVAGEKGKSYASLSPAEKIMIDQKVQKRKGAIEKIAKRLLPQVKKADRERLSKVNEQFEDFLLEAEDPDVGSNPGSQPKAYYKGLSKAEKEARAKHFARYKDSDDDKAASYRSAPGDKGTETKPSKYTKRYHQMFNKEGRMNFDRRFRAFRHIQKEEALPLVEEMFELYETDEAVKNKAKESGVPYSILKQVYDRGIAAWRTGHRPGATPQQWALARLNSFLTGGKTQKTTDSDLWKEYKGIKEEKIAHALDPNKTLKHAMKDATASIDWDMDGDVDILDKMKVSPDEITGAEKKDMTKAAKRRAAGEKKHMKIGVAYEEVDLKETIRKEGSKWVIYSKDGFKKLGEYDTETAAKKRLRQIEYFKHMNEGEAMDAAKEKIKQEKQSDKEKHDRMLDRARLADAQAKNMSEETDQCAIISKKELVELEKFADKLLEKYGIDIEFTKHFGERMSDSRNNPCITINELRSFFRKIYANQGKKIKSVGIDQAVLKDIQRSLNIPVVIGMKNGELEVTLKTIMRKKNFTTPNKIVKYEEVVHNKCGTPDCCGQCDTASIDESFSSLLHKKQYDAALSVLKDVMSKKRNKTLGYYASEIAKQYKNVDARKLSDMYSKLEEKSGAGEEGTDELANTYKKDTPGQ